jgi:hypothetical protein
MEIATPVLIVTEIAALAVSADKLFSAGCFARPGETIA